MRIVLYAVYGKENYCYCYCSEGIKIIHINGKYDDLHTFQYISNKIQRYTVYLYLETAVHVSRGTSIHQERIQ
jgi:hypothetical protein